MFPLLDLVIGEAGIETLMQRGSCAITWVGDYCLLNWSNEFARTDGSVTLYIGNEHMGRILYQVLLQHIESLQSTGIFQSTAQCFPKYCDESTVIKRCMNLIHI